MTSETIKALMIIGMFGALEIALHPFRLRSCGMRLRDAFVRLLPTVSPLHYAVAPVRIRPGPHYR